MFNREEISFIRFAISATCIFCVAEVYSLEWPKDNFRPSLLTPKNIENEKKKAKNKERIEDADQSIQVEIIFAAASLKVKSHTSLSKSKLFSDKIFGAKVYYQGNWTKNIEEFYEYKILKKSYLKPKSLEVSDSSFINHFFKMGSFFYDDSWKVGASFNIQNEGLLEAQSQSSMKFSSEWFYGVGLYLGRQEMYNDYKFSAMINYTYLLAKDKESLVGVDRMTSYMGQLEIVRDFKNKEYDIGINTQYGIKKARGTTNKFELKELNLAFSIKWKL